MHYPLTTLSRYLVYNSIKLISLRYGPWNSWFFFNIIRFTTRNIRNVDSVTNLQKIRLLGLDIKYLSYGINTNFDYFFTIQSADGSSQELAKSSLHENQSNNLTVSNVLSSWMTKIHVSKQALLASMITLQEFVCMFHES